MSCTPPPSASRTRKGSHPVTYPSQGHPSSQGPKGQPASLHYKMYFRKSDFIRMSLTRSLTYSAVTTTCWPALSGASKEISSTMRSMMVCSLRAPMFSTVLLVCVTVTVGQVRSGGISKGQARTRRAVSPRGLLVQSLGWHRR